MRILSFLKSADFRNYFARISKKLSLFLIKLKFKISEKYFIVSMPGFNAVLKKIIDGEPLSPNDLVPYLSTEKLGNRIAVNFELAKTYVAIKNYHQASVFINRVWFFSGYEEKYLPLLVDINTNLEDTDAIGNAYKRIGVRKAEEGDIDQALHYFNLWHYVYARYHQKDRYYYDDEVLSCIRKLAAPYLWSQNQISCEKQTKIAYLLYGLDHSSSVIVKIALIAAQFHDKSKFKVAFFAPLKQSVLNSYLESLENITKIFESGCEFYAVPEVDSPYSNELLNLSGKIREFGADILITTAGLADLKHLFIAETKPAPLIVGFCQGPPPQFISPSFDWAISWSKHPLIDCPVDCSYIKLETKLPEKRKAKIPCDYFDGEVDNPIIVMSCGRVSKFQDVDFWNAILQFLKHNQHACYVAVGLENPPTFLPAMLSAQLLGRIKFIGWANDYLKTLAMADVVVDTYPSGGGVTIMDAMALGIPAISFENNYLNEFDQMDWSAACEFIDIPELLIKRGDFEQLVQVLSMLSCNKEYRDELSEICAVNIRNNVGSPEKMIRECEDVYSRLLKAKR